VRPHKEQLTDGSRDLAKAWRERERTRKALSTKLITTERRAAQLHVDRGQGGIIGSKTRPRSGPGDSWARDQLALLDSFLNPNNLASDLKAQNLFQRLTIATPPSAEPPPIARSTDIFISDEYRHTSGATHPHAGAQGCRHARR
jgi:hypothetical protein